METGPAATRGNQDLQEGGKIEVMEDTNRTLGRLAGRLAHCGYCWYALMSSSSLQDREPPRSHRKARGVAGSHVLYTAQHPLRSWED